MHATVTRGLALLALVGFSASGPAQTPFTAGNLIIYRVGTGAAVLNNAATAVFLDEYTQASTATLVQSLALPTAIAGPNNRVTASGTASSEGMIQLGNLGRTLAFTGYDADVGIGAVAGTTTATVKRVVGIVGGNAVVDTSTGLTDYASGTNPRSAYPLDATNLYFAGGTGGVRYATLGSTTSTQISTLANVRTVQVAGGQLYLSSSSGTTRIATVGTGTPTTGTQANPNVPGTPSTGSPYQFYFARLGNPSFAGPNVLYVADDTATNTGNPAGQIQKYVSTDGTTFSASGAAIAAAVRGLTGVVTGDNSIQLFGTTGGTAAAGGGSLYSLADAAVFTDISNPTAGTALSGTAATTTTAATNTAFRGLAFAPAVLVWNGAAGNATWNLTATNFNNTTPSTPVASVYLNAYTANFTQAGGGAVTVGAGINPVATVVSHISGTYTFTNDMAAPRGIQGVGSLTKDGAGTLVLNSTNTYSGGTVVNGGTLIAGSVGRGPLTVATGARVVAGTQQPAAAVAPAVLTVSTATFANGADFGVQLTGTLTTSTTGASGTPGVNNSQIAATTGGLIVNGTRVVVDLTGATFGSGTNSPYSFLVGTGPGSSSVGGNTFLFTQNGADVTAAITNQFTPTLDLVAPNVILTFAPVPEPTTMLAVAAVGLGGVRFARRRLTASNRRPA